MPSSPTAKRATPPEVEARLAAGILVNALIRHVEAEGGHGIVIARGDATAGALLIELRDRGEAGPLLERTLGNGGYAWRDSGPADPSERADYLARRRKSDPDLWILELDHPRARELASAILD